MSEVLIWRRGFSKTVHWIIVILKFKTTNWLKSGHCLKSGNSISILPRNLVINKLCCNISCLHFKMVWNIRWSSWVVSSSLSSSLFLSSSSSEGTFNYLNHHRFTLVMTSLLGRWESPISLVWRYGDQTMCIWYCDVMLPSNEPPCNVTITELSLESIEFNTYSFTHTVSHAEVYMRSFTDTVDGESFTQVYMKSSYMQGCTQILQPSISRMTLILSSVNSHQAKTKIFYAVQAFESLKNKVFSLWSM